MSTVNVFVREAIATRDASERARLASVAISAMEDEWEEMRELLARREEAFNAFIHGHYLYSLSKGNA